MIDKVMISSKIKKILLIQFLYIGILPFILSIFFGEYLSLLKLFFYFEFGIALVVIIAMAILFMVSLIDDIVNK